MVILPFVNVFLPSQTVFEPQKVFVMRGPRVGEELPEWLQPQRPRMGRGSTGQIVYS